MSMTHAERSALLKMRNQRRLNWDHVESKLRALGLSASRLSDEEHDRVKSLFSSLNPCAALLQNAVWADEARQFAKDRFAVLIGDPWHADVQPIARVAGPPLAAKAESLLEYFIDGFWLADPDARHFYFVDVSEDQLTGELAVETAMLEASNA